MKPSAIVVFESMFGNTRVIAEAIADGLRETCEVTVGTVDAIAPERAREVSLVVVGGPTHSLGVARADARTSDNSTGGMP